MVSDRTIASMVEPQRKCAIDATEQIALLGSAGKEDGGSLETWSYGVSTGSLQVSFEDET